MVGNVLISAMNFSLNHISTLCKYTGISFTAGAITHGAFSEQRSLITALIGISIYLLGGILEKVAHPDAEHSWANLLAVGVMSSVGLGFFTGGLQHFPDSPDRSSWVVPVGFLMSLIAVYLMGDKNSSFPKAAIKKIIVYGLFSFAIVLLGSLYAASYFRANPIPDHHAAPLDKSQGKPPVHDHSTHRH